MSKTDSHCISGKRENDILSPETKDFHHIRGGVVDGKCGDKLRAPAPEPGPCFSGAFLGQSLCICMGQGPWKILFKKKKKHRNFTQKSVSVKNGSYFSEFTDILVIKIHPQNPRGAPKLRLGNPESAMAPFSDVVQLYESPPYDNGTF